MNTDTEDAGGCADVVVREIDLEAWRQKGGNLWNRRPMLYVSLRTSSAQ